MRKTLRLAAALGTATVALSLAGVGVYLGCLQALGNVHTVIPGELYRSATLAPERLAALVAEQGIRTVVNLRGGSPDRGWLRDEIAAAKAGGARVVTLHWAAHREVSDDEVATFFRVIAESPKPILIHCKSGSDRTGLAVALYLAKLKGASELRSEIQLSILYGHLGVPVLSVYAMDRTFERLEPSLGFFGS
jgi:protein tyrosine/serine phosphatase